LSGSVFTVDLIFICRNVHDYNSPRLRFVNPRKIKSRSGADCS
jgi:hypothetical protein